MYVFNRLILGMLHIKCLYDNFSEIFSHGRGEKCVIYQNNESNVFK